MKALDRFIPRWRIGQARRFIPAQARVIDGMSLEEHYGFEPADPLRIFAAPHFRLFPRSRFQGGLNHRFVFERLG